LCTPKGFEGNFVLSVSLTNIYLSTKKKKRKEKKKSFFDQYQMSPAHGHLILLQFCSNVNPFRRLWEWSFGQEYCANFRNKYVYMYMHLCSIYAI
jgi:hypothetical protein